MCTTCGCAAGNVKIEQGHDHHHEDGEHAHTHHHEHGEHHEHPHVHTHTHSHDSQPHGHSHTHEHHHGRHHEHSHRHAQVIHHYHGPVHIHYHVDSSFAESTFHHEHDHHQELKTEPIQDFKPEQEGDDFHYGQGAAHSHAPGMTQSRMVQIETDILAKNNSIAQLNRTFLEHRNVRSFNLVSSPGSGKTTLLTETLKQLDLSKCAVIEGDQQTTNDADRIRETGAPAIQINTGKGCHLDAQMVAQAIAHLAPKQNSLLFIENVGNLVCPAAFDLGESHKVAILSVTEGEDKPLKYPDIFADADVMIINKVDLLPHLNFDVEACIQNAKRINAKMKIMLVSATTGEGMQTWLDWLNDPHHNKDN